MDPPRKPITTPSSHLKPPPHHTPRPTSTSSSTTSSTATNTPRAPITAHPTATIADTAVFQGTHPISIGAGTIIHPRARIYSFQGPVIIEETCIIGEKSVIGTPPTSTSTIQGGRAMQEKEDSTLPLPTTLSENVTLGPSVTIHPGVRLSSGVLLEALVTLHARVTIGEHSKVCAGAEVPASTAVKEWMVLWGSVGSGGLRRRVRARGKMTSVTAQAQGTGQVLEAGVIEEARLVVLEREREALGRLIGGGSAGRRR